MELQITIESNTLPDTEVKELLEAQLVLSNSDVNLELRRKGIKYRGSPDPTVLVAIVGLTGSAIGALISGLLNIIGQKASGQLRFESKNGAVLVVPANTRLEDIDKLIEKLKQIDLEKIILP